MLESRKGSCFSSLSVGIRQSPSVERRVPPAGVGDGGHGDARLEAAPDSVVLASYLTATHERDIGPAVGAAVGYRAFKSPGCCAPSSYAAPWSISPARCCPALSKSTRRGFPAAPK